MTNLPTQLEWTTGLTLSAFPVVDDDNNIVSLSLWSSKRKPVTEYGSPNLGRYSVTITDEYPLWAILEEGASQPANWNNDTLIRIRVHDDELAASVIATGGTTSSRLEQYRGTIWNFQIDDMIIEDTIIDAWFTLRARNSDDEDESVVQISIEDGLLISNGEPALDSSLGELVITEVSGVSTAFIRLNAEETTKYTCSDLYVYDLKVLTSSGPIIKQKSKYFSILADVTRKIA